MSLLESTLILILVSAVECQIVFPNNGRGTSRPNLPVNNQSIRKNSGLDGCKTNNDQAGTCYEFRSIQFKQCSFFPSINTIDQSVAQHLRENVCKNSGKEIYFCCPNGTPIQPPTEVPPSMVPDVIATMSRPSFIPSEGECGNPNSDNVIGGEFAARGAWPWLAALGEKIDTGFIPFCGGTLITNQHVITAAHCFTRQRNFVITVRLGEHDVNEVNDGAQDFTIAEMRVGDYNITTRENDIMLLKLDRPISSFTERIRPACLPYHLRNENFEGNKPIVVGWGIFNNRDGRTSPVPLQAPVEVVPIPECQQQYRLSGNVIDDRQICAGRGLTDSCGGDSGGPLNYVDTQNFRFYVIGLVSFGPRNCASENLPGVYLRITSYLNWIEQNIRQLL